MAAHLWSVCFDVRRIGAEFKRLPLMIFLPARFFIAFLPQALLSFLSAAFVSTGRPARITVILVHKRGKFLNFLLSCFQRFSQFLDLLF